jgi:hypothetical protein
MFLLSIILLLRTIKKKVLTNIVNEFYGHMIDLRDQESKDKTNVLIGCHQKSKNKTNVLIGCHQKSKNKTNVLIECHQKSKNKTNVLIGCHQEFKDKTNVLIGCHQKSKKKNVPICTIKVVILYSGSVKTRKCSKFEI